MQIRNVAIIAHVDHGKTTLVDKLLGQSGAFREHQAVTDRALDRNDLEKERGITILAKCASVVWKDTRINIVDTPGHADFGGEVERILNMVDGALVLVDAAEGVLPQTKFVVGKALARGIHPIVIVNKVDRQDARPDEVHTEIFDLFAALGASDSQLDFPMLYASGRNGWADTTLEGPRKDLSAMFDLILSHVPEPTVKRDAPFAMVASILEYDNFLGRVLTGRVEQGTGRINMQVKVLRQDGSVVETGRLTKLLSFRGLERVPVEEVAAGDIIAVAGLSESTIPDTIGAPELTAPLEAIPVDPPTLAMTFRINDSPLAGREGKKVTSRQIRERLFRESEGNVAIKVTELERNRRVRGCRPRRTPAWRADRADAPRRLRTHHWPPARADPAQPGDERARRADGGSAGRCGRALHRHRRREAGAAQRRHARHAAVRRRQGAHDLQHPQPRADWLPQRIPDRHARHRDHEPAVRRLWPVEGADRRPPRRVADLHRGRRGGAYSLWYIQERGTMFVSPGRRSTRA